MRSRILLAVAVAVGCSLAGTNAALALPSLQLGAGSGNWTYDTGTGTWVTADNPLQLLATANATKEDGGKGAYAWSEKGTLQYAYLVVAAVPKTNSSDALDITVQNDGGSLALYTSGYGAPPVSDPNSLADHGIFDSYFEIYEFNFDGALTTISNTQPPGGGSGAGFTELFNIAINSLGTGVNAIHFDLFTVAGSGRLNGTSLVSAFAPFSHDAQAIPEPGAVAVFAIGNLVAGALIRRFTARKD